MADTPAVAALVAVEEASAVVAEVLVVVAHRGVGRMRNSQSLAEKFLTAAEQQNVSAVVQDMERSTSGEIVPMVVSRSHDYPMAAVSCCVSMALPLALLLTNLIGARIWIGSQNMWLFLGVLAALYGLLYPLITRSDRLKYFFLNRKQAAREVEEAALSAFYRQRLHDTKDANGILLYISVMEQMVWILADTNINTKIDQQEWDSIITQITAGIKAGKSAQAVCQAVHSIGQILQRHFPVQKDDKDELHNLIIL